MLLSKLSRSVGAQFVSRLRAAGFALSVGLVTAGAGLLSGCIRDEAPNIVTMPAGHQLLDTQWLGANLWATLYEPATQQCYSGYFSPEGTYLRRVTFKNCTAPGASLATGQSSRGVGTSFVAALGEIADGASPHKIEPIPTGIPHVR